MLAKRAFASAASAVRPPIQTYGIEGKYAASLYTASYKKQSLDLVDKDLQKVKELYTSSKEFKVCLLHRFTFSGLCPKPDSEAYPEEERRGGHPEEGRSHCRGPELLR